jgi:hypothetical protein
MSNAPLYGWLVIAELPHEPQRHDASKPSAPPTLSEPIRKRGVRHWALQLLQRSGWSS